MLAFRSDILESIAREDPLHETLDRLCSGGERLLPGCALAVVTVDSAVRMQWKAGPAFPPVYIAALDGLLAGPTTGSCGAAIYYNEITEVTDIERDPRWVSFKTLALPLGFRACTSVPIRNKNGNAIGAFAAYLPEARALKKREWRIVNECVRLCHLALARHDRITEWERLANLDGLTGLPNRRAFDEAISRLPCELSGRWALFVVDLDNLKVTNDTFGHDAGDALICAVGHRTSDVLFTDATFRTGGDEFVTIIQDPESLHDLDGAAKRLLQAIAEPIRHKGNVFVPRVTIGAAVLGPQDLNPETVRRNADFALYHAKDTRRGEFVRYWSGIGTRMANRHHSIQEMAKALSDGRTDAYYQPVVRLDSYEIVGFEALCRVTNEAGRVVSASLFQDAFADADIGSEVTDRMLNAVARDIRAWLDRGLIVQHVGVNITSADFYLGNLISRIESAFDAQNVPLDHLIAEVTEQVYIGQRDNVIVSGIRDLRIRGVRVALDDFGTGFAALTHLMNVPVDIIKIDQLFTRRLAPAHPSTAIVRGLTQIAHDLGIKLIAEGVETTEQIEALRAMGCQLGQGYVFSKAVNREAAATLLKEHGQYMPGARPLMSNSTPQAVRYERLSSRRPARR